MSLSRINLFAQNTIEENRLLSELHNSKLFLYGLINSLIFIIFCFPLTQKIWFIDFINNSFESFGFDPWTKYINLGEDKIKLSFEQEDNSEDLVNSEPLWEDGYKSLIQLIILLQVADILHKRGV